MRVMVILNGAHAEAVGGKCYPRDHDLVDGEWGRLATGVRGNRLGDEVVFFLGRA